MNSRVPLSFSTLRPESRIEKSKTFSEHLNQNQSDRKYRETQHQSKIASDSGQKVQGGDDSIFLPNFHHRRGKVQEDVVIIKLFGIKLRNGVFLNEKKKV